jgi:hypothetical protein
MSLLGNSAIHVEQNISFMNETKWYKIKHRPKGWVQIIIFCSIWVSFEFCQFQSHNLKALAKVKKVNIAFTLSLLIIFAGLTISFQLKFLCVILNSQAYSFRLTFLCLNSNGLAYWNK